MYKGQHTAEQIFFRGLATIGALLSVYCGLA